MTQEIQYQMKWFNPGYLSRLVKLHKSCFPEEVWTQEDFYAFLERSGQKNIIKILIDELSDKMYGAVLYSINERARECRIRRIGVFKRFRESGMATRMLRSLTMINSPLRRYTLIARVHERNLAAQKLFTKTGFVFDPALKREKDRNNEDIYVFKHTNSDVPSGRPCIREGGSTY